MCVHNVSPKEESLTVPMKGERARHVKAFDAIISPYSRNLWRMLDINIQTTYETWLDNIVVILVFFVHSVFRSCGADGQHCSTLPLLLLGMYHCIAHITGIVFK